MVKFRSRHMRRNKQIQFARKKLKNNLILPQNIIQPNINDRIETCLSLSLADKVNIDHISLLKEVMMSMYSIQHIAKRLISTFIFCLLRFHKNSYKQTQDLLSGIGCNDIRTATHWTNLLLNNRDPFVLLEEKRKNTTDDFYENYPELKKEAMLFAMERMSSKIANFKAKDLSKFINEKFTELYGKVIEDGVFVRSERSCRRDLLKWGAKFEPNKKRPYFEGHERPDVVRSRNKFVSFFDISANDFGYMQKEINASIQLEKNPVRIEDKHKYLLVSHDESTFRCGETAVKRWVWNDVYTFFNKGILNF